MIQNSDLLLQNNHDCIFDNLSEKALLNPIPAFPIIQQDLLLPRLLPETPGVSSSTLQTVQKWSSTTPAPGDSRHILVDAPLSHLAPDCPEVILFLYPAVFTPLFTVH